MVLDREILSDLLNNLEMTIDTKSAREAIETLLKIYRNILHNEENTHYRVIKPENPTFSKKIWNIYPCRQFMLLTGWIEVRGQLVFNSDENLLDVIEILLEHRDITPCAEEWDENSKHEGTSEAQIREENLRRKAAIEREKKLEEHRKDKKKREDIAKDIKSKIAADRQRQKLFTEPVVMILQLLFLACWILWLGTNL